MPAAALGDDLRRSCPEGRDALRAAARRRRALALEGVDLVMHARRRRGGVRRGAGAASCASRPAATCATRAAARWSRRRRPRRRRRARRGRRPASAPDYPDALGRVWAALTCPTSGDVLLSRRARLRVPRLGRRRPRRRRQPRLAAPQRLARRAAVLRRRAAAGTRARRLVDRRRRPPTGTAPHFGLTYPRTAMRDEAAAVALPLRRRVRHGLRQPAQLVPARALRRWSAPAATS